MKIIRNTIITLIVGVGFITIIPSLNKVFAATRTWDGGGATNNWSECANWDGPDICPTSADAVVFSATSTKNATVDAAFGGNVLSVSVNTGYTGTITMAETLEVSTTFTMQNASITTWDSSSKTLIIEGAFTLNNANATFKASSGTSIFLSTFTITAGTFTHNSGVVNFGGGAANINCNSSSSSLFNSVNFTGQTNTKTIGNTSACNLPLGANPTIPNGIILTNATLTGTGTMTVSTGTLTLNSTSAVLSGFNGLSLLNLTISTAAVTLDLSGYSSFTSTGTVTSTTGTITMPTAGATLAALTINGGTFIASSGTTTISSTFSITSGIFTHNSGTVDFSGAAANINCNSSSSSLFNSVNFTGQTGVKSIGATSACNLPVGASPTIPNGITLNTNGVFTGTGTLTITTGAFTIANNTLPALSGFSGLIVGGPFNTSATTGNNSVDLSAYTTVAFNNTFVLSTPTGFTNTFTAPTGTMTVGNTFTVNTGASFIGSSGTLNFNGTTSATMSCNGSITGLGTVGFTHTGGTKTVASACSFPIGASPTLGTGNSNTGVTLNGTLSGSGTITTDILTLNAGAVLSGFNGIIGGGSITISGATIDWSAYGTANLGTFVLSSGSFTAPTGTMTVSGNFTVSGGTFLANGGTITFNGSAGGTAVITCVSAALPAFNLVNFTHTSGAKNISSGCTMPLATSTLTATTSSITLNGTLSGSGTLTYAGGTFFLNPGAVLSGFSGINTNGLTISGATLNLGSYSPVTVNIFNLSSGTFTAPSGTMTITNSLTISSGTFIANNGTIAYNPTAPSTFAGGNSTFYDVQLQGVQTVTFSGSNTFHTLTGTAAARTVKFTAGSTQKITSMNGFITGTAGNVQTLQSTSSGVPWFLYSTVLQSSDYLSLQDSSASDPGLWYAGANSTNVSGNSGWIFATPSYSVASPALYYKFNEGDGLVAHDSSGNNNTGTITANSPVWENEDQCLSGKCLFFDGTQDNGRVVTNVNGISATQGTLSVWAKNTDVSNPATRKYIYAHTTGGGNRIYLFEDTDGIIKFLLGDTTLYSSSKAQDTNIWHLYTLSWNNGTYNFYYDSKFLVTGSYSSLTTIGNASYVGSQTSAGTQWQGFIDEFKIYPYARNAAQIQAEYNGRSSLIGSTATGGFQPQPNYFPNGLTAWWPLDDTNPLQSYARALNSSAAPGRNMILTPDFSSSTGWTTSGNWSIGSGVATSTPGGGGGNLTAAIPVVAGKAYTVTYTVTFSAFNSLTPTLGGTALTNRATNGTYVENVIAGSGTANLIFPANPALGATIDNVTVVQVNVPFSGSSPTQLLADGDMEASGISAWGIQNSATVSKQIGTPHGGARVLRVARNGVSTPYAFQVILTVGNVYRLTGYTRSDGSATPKIYTSGTTTTLFSGTTSTAWQPFDVVFVATAAGMGFGTDTNTGTQYVEFDDMVVSPDNYIRSGELSVDGGLESWTNATTPANWVTSIAGTSTVNQETSVIHSGNNAVRFDIDASNNVAQISQLMVAKGKTYTVTFWAKSDAASGVSLAVANGTVGNYIAQNLTSTYTQYSITFVALDTTLTFKRGTATSHSIYIDDISVTEVSPLSGLVIQTTAVTGVVATTNPTVASASGGHLANAYTFDGSNDNVNIYSSDLNSAFNPNEGTLVAWAQVSPTEWASGTTRYLLILNADTTNDVIYVRKTASNTLQFDYTAGGTNENASPVVGGSANWFQVVITWSKSNDQVKFYFNGAQQGATQTGLGTWSGNLTAGLNVLGAFNNNGSVGPWLGMINDAQLYNRALSAAEIATAYNNASSTLNVTSGVNPPQTPTGYWKFDEQQGQTVNNSISGGSALNGTLGANSSVASDDPTWIPSASGNCKVNGCIQLDGVNDFVNLTPSLYPLYNSGKFSISAWINISSLTNSSAIYSEGRSGSVNGFILFYVRNDGRLEFRTSDTSGNLNQYTAAAPILNTGQWYYVAVSVDGTSTPSLYVNGEKQAYANSTTSFTAALPTLNEAAIGNFLRNTGSDFFAGYLDSIRIYTTALTAQQVSVDMNAKSSENFGVTAPIEASLLSGGAGNAPVGYWNFEDATQGTSVQDISGNGYAGTFVNTPKWVPGKIGSALLFNGSDNYVTMSDQSVLNAKAGFTVSGWVNRSGDSNGTASNIANKWSATGWFLDVIDSTDGSQPNKVRFFISGITVTSVFSLSNIPNNTWQYVTAVYDGVKLYIYINGRLDNSSASTGTPTTTTNPFQIGFGVTSSGANNYFNGKLDDIKVYNYARTPAQIEYDYNRGTPIGWWKFNECTGTVANDSSGNGFNGAITIGATGTQTTAGTCTTAGTAWGNGAIGKYNSSLNYDGTDDVTNLYSANLASAFNPSEGTISVWAKVSGAGAWTDNTSKQIANLAVDSSGNNQVFLRMRAAPSVNTIQFIYGAGGVAGQNLSTLALGTTLNWFQLGMTWSKSADQVKFYINGQQVGTTATGLGTWVGSLGSAFTVLGNFNSGGSISDWSGQIDDTRLYNYALSASQMQEVYNQGSSVRFGPLTGTP